MNALTPAMVESPSLHVVGLFRHGRLLPVRIANEYDAFVSLALTQRRLYWRNRAMMNEAEERGDLAYYRERAADGRRLWREAKYHLAKARERIEWAH